MKIFTPTFLLFVLAACYGGSAWGEDSAGRCREADSIVASFAGLTGDAPPSQVERVLSLCPDGTSGHFAKGVRYEQEGQPESAIAEYRQALAADDNLHGEATAQQF